MVLLPLVTALLLAGSALALSIVDLLQKSDQFEILLQNLEKHNLLDFLINANNVTLLAPVTSAFHDVGDSKEINRNLLEYHIIEGELHSEPDTRRIGYSLTKSGQLLSAGAFRIHCNQPQYFHHSLQYSGL